MAFSDTWKALTAKKPELLNPNSTCSFTAANLRKLLEQVYERGRSDGGSVMGGMDDLFRGLGK